jgi:hypothetical protein
MDLDIYTVCGIAGACLLTFSLIGGFALWVASYQGRRQFRAKGYLRVPSGSDWFRFLFRRHYDSFELSSRYLFELARFCLLVVIFVGGAMIILVGSALLLALVASGH